MANLYVIAGFGKRFNGVPKLQVMHNTMTRCPIRSRDLQRMREHWLPTVFETAAVYTLKDQSLELRYRSIGCKVSTPDRISLSPVWREALHSPSAVPKEPYRISNALKKYIQQLRNRWTLQTWPPPGATAGDIDFPECESVRLLYTGPATASVAAAYSSETSRVLVYVHQTGSTVAIEYSPCDISIHPRLFSSQLHRQLMSYGLAPPGAEGGLRVTHINRIAAAGIEFDAVNTNAVPVVLQLTAHVEALLVEEAHRSLEVLVTDIKGLL